MAYFDYDLEGQIIGRADKASAQTNAAFFAGYAADPDGVAASGDGESGFSGFSFFNPSETQKVQRQLFGSQFTSSASTGLQNYLYANNKPISQASGNQTLALKKLTLQGGQPIEAPIDPLTGQPGASTGSRLSLQESDIARTAGVIDRAITARKIAERAYAGPPGFAQLSTAAQAKVVAYIQAQLPPDAELIAGAAVTLHAFILMVDASYTGLAQITDYSLRQLGSDGIPGGTVQSHVVRAGDTLQTIAQIYFGSPAYWYLIADANGLSGSERLAEGVTLTIPNKVANSANSAQTFKVYNESEVIGSTSPEIRTVAKKKKWYQKLIQILIIVILVIAVIVTAGAALAIAGAATPGLLALGASLASAVGAVGVGGAVVLSAGAGFAAAAAIGAAVYATASILTQGLAVAAGLQESFSWKAVGKAAVTGAVSGGAGFLAAPLAGANAYSASNVALRVGIEAGKQVILEGKITNVAGLVGAAAAGGAFKDMGESGSALQAAGNFASNNSATFGAGLALLESKVRGQGNNAMQWVALATAAAFDSGALSAGGDQPDKTGVASRATSPQYFTSGGDLNWRVVAAQAIGTAIVSNRMGSEAAIGYFGNAVAEFAVQAGGRAMDERVAARASAEASAEAKSVFRRSEVADQNQAQAQSDALYGLSTGRDGQGLKIGGGEGLRYGSIRATGYDRNDDLAAGPPQPGMKFTDGGWQNLDGSAPGADGSPTADTSAALKKQGEAMRQGWNRQGWSVLQGERPIAYDLANSTRNFLGGITGYDATNAARASFAQGNNVTGTLQLMQAFGEAGTTVFGFGGAGSATAGLRAGGMSAGELAGVRATYLETRVGNSSLAVPGVEYATVNGQKVFPQNYSQLYHGTDNATLGLPKSMLADDVAQHLYSNGLPARGANIDLIEHTINNAPDRAFRGTTVVPITQERNAGAAFWAGDGGLVIEMKAVRGYDVNAVLEGRALQNGRYGGNPKFGELEVAVPGAISPGSISRVGVPTVNRNGVPEVQWIARKQ